MDPFGVADDQTPGKESGSFPPVLRDGDAETDGVGAFGQALGQTQAEQEEFLLGSRSDRPFGFRQRVFPREKRGEIPGIGEPPPADTGMGRGAETEIGLAGPIFQVVAAFPAGQREI